MIDITLIINGLDLGNWLSSYNVSQEVNYTKVVTTMDGVEHSALTRPRSIITFSLMPLTDEESTKIYSALSSLVFNATFTNMHSGKDETRRVRVASNIDSTFLLLSVDGKRRYKGNSIQLRAL